jgi:F1F0 ATPase subunit 2
MSVSLASLFLAVVAGAAFGAVYLGLLWVAVQTLPADRNGVGVFVALGLARIALLVGALAAAAALGLSAPEIAAALGGFVALRFAATRWLGDQTPGGQRWK